MLLFLFGFSLCLNILFIIISIFIYKNYKKSSPVNLQEIALNSFHDVCDMFDIRNL